MKRGVISIFALSGALLAYTETTVGQATAWTFDDAAARAACARTTEPCEEASFDEDLCKQARKAVPDCTADTRSGVLCKLDLKDIAPTQISVGVHAAACKAKGKFSGRNSDEIHNYLLESAHHIPAVIGPKNQADNRFYITDHHHLSYALWLANTAKYTDVNTVYACVLANRKEEKTSKFWAFMVRERLTWLNDQHGKAISPSDLGRDAPSLNDMYDDPYRTWSRWVRDSCGYLKAGSGCVPISYPATAAYFMEFRWADYLQRNLPGHENIKHMSDKEIEDVLKAAVATAQAPQAFLEALPGYSDGSVVPVKYVDINNRCD